MSPTLRRRTGQWLLGPLLLLALLLWWDWNWFKPLAERQASAAIGRTVSIGDLDVALGRYPQIVASEIRVANPEGWPAGEPPMTRVGRFTVRIGLAALFKRRVEISRLEFDEVVATLRSRAGGEPNWLLRLPAREDSPSPWVVEIAGLSIRDSRFSVVDAAARSDFSGTLATQPLPQGGEAQLLLSAAGRLAGERFTARFTGGSLLSLRTPENPYPVDFEAEAGATRIALKGSLLDPLQLAGAKLRLSLQGRNLSALADLLKLPLPNTPPYALAGDLDYRAGRVLFKKFTGLMGQSDLAGDLSVELGAARPLLTATVRAAQVRLEDLTGLIGGDPNAPAANAANGDGRVIPSAPINLPRLRAADVRLDFTGKRIVGDKLPFDRLAFKLAIDDGVMTVSPADFGIGEGALRFYVTLDPRGEQFGLDGRAELRRVDVSRLMQRTGYQGSGRLGGSVVLKSKGRSAAELLGRGNGELKLAMAGGDFSALLLDLSGLDFGNALLSAIGIGKRTEVRCLVGDFVLVNGRLDTRSFILDTGNTNLLLDGGANLADETLALRLRTEPKRANVGRLKAPIYISGRFADPSIRPDYVDIGVRSAAAVAMGVLLTPLAALLPTLQLGPGEDRDCKALLASAEIKAPAQPAAR